MRSCTVEAVLREPVHVFKDWKPGGTAEDLAFVPEFGMKAFVMVIYEVKLTKIEWGSMPPPEIFIMN